MSAFEGNAMQASLGATSETVPAPALTPEEMAVMSRDESELSVFSFTSGVSESAIEVDADDQPPSPAQAQAQTGAALPMAHVPRKGASDDTMSLVDDDDVGSVLGGFGGGNICPRPFNTTSTVIAASTVTNPDMEQIFFTYVPLPPLLCSG
jgi:hypothetical protein